MRMSGVDTREGPSECVRNVIGESRKWCLRRSHMRCPYANPGSDVLDGPIGDVHMRFTYVASLVSTDIQMNSV